MDLFAEAGAQFDFSQAVDAVVAAYRRDGLQADAVANKVCALFGRAEVRDYVDVAAILASGRYSKEDLVRLAEEHDPGFDPSWFA